MEKYVECRRGSYTLRGMFHVPDTAADRDKIPAVILLNGFTATRDESAFSHVKLSRMLQAEGIASVRFDFMGSGESDGEFSEMSVETEVSDAEKMLEFVKTLEFVRKDRIAFHGMSQGGLVSCLTAARHPDEVACLSLWSPGLCIGDFCREKKLLGIDISRLEKDGFAGIKGLRLGAVYYRDGKNVDVYKEMQNYRKRVQIIHGDCDITIPLACSEKLKDQLGDRCELKVVKGADHGYGTVEQNEYRIRQSVSFLKEQLL